MTDAIAARLRETYTRQAATFDQQRDKSLFEKSWLDAFLGHVPAGGHVLDLGCGSGAPIAGYVMSQGRHVTGVDAAPPMLDIARARFPDAIWLDGDIRHLDLTGPYDGILGWNSVFHLTAAEQRQVIPQLCALLGPGAPLMITVGPGDGEATGHVGGETVYHASLDRAEYQTLLETHDCRVEQAVLEDAACNGHSVLLAVNAA